MAAAKFNSMSSSTPEKALVVKPTKVSGTKIRGLLMQINKLTKEERKKILETQKLIPKKTRVKKETVVKEEEDQDLVEKVVSPTPPVKVVKSTKSKKKI